jgi:hypothetical protein
MRSRLLLGALAALLVTLALTGCSDGQGDRGDAQRQADASAARATARGEHRAERRLRSYMRASFSGTSWHSDIRGYDVRETSAFVNTDLYPDGDAAAPARAICNAVRLSGVPRTDYVYVNDSAGDQLTQCSRAAAPS